MKALLVGPRQTYRGSSASCPAKKIRRLRYPTGLYLIAAMLEANGFQAPVVDLEIMDTDLPAILEKEQPDIVGITAATANRFEAIGAARTTRSTLPDVLIAVGGPHFTFTAEDALRHIPEIDLVVRGEGEATMLEVARSLATSHDWRDVAGISYMANGEPRHNSDRPRIRDLDELPSISWDSIPWDKYDYRFMNMPCASILTGRGCPVNCTFCSTTKMWGKHLRWRSPERVVDDIEYLLGAYGFEAIFFDDDTFTLNRRHLLGILDEIERRQLKFHWICQARVDTVNRELLERMKRAGCYYIYFGVETGSPKMLDSIHKRITNEQVSQTVRDCHAVGILCHALFMYALPDETEEDRQLTLAIMEQLIDEGLDSFSANPTIIYPGTEVETTARSRSVLPEGFSWSEPYYDARIEELMAGMAHTPLYTEMLSPDDMLVVKQRIIELRQPLQSTLRVREARAYRRVPHYVRGFIHARSTDDLKAQVAQGREILGALARLAKDRVSIVK